MSCHYDESCVCQAHDVTWANSLQGSLMNVACNLAPRAMSNHQSYFCKGCGRRASYLLLPAVALRPFAATTEGI